MFEQRESVKMCFYSRKTPQRLFWRRQRLNGLFAKQRRVSAHNTKNRTTASRVASFSPPFPFPFPFAPFLLNFVIFILRRLFFAVFFFKTKLSIFPNAQFVFVLFYFCVTPNANFKLLLGHALHKLQLKNGKLLLFYSTPRSQRCFFSQSKRSCFERRRCTNRLVKLRRCQRQKKRRGCGCYGACESVPQR